MHPHSQQAAWVDNIVITERESVYFQSNVHSTLLSSLAFSICVEKLLKDKYILVGKIADELLHEKQFVEYIQLSIAKNSPITDPDV